MISSGKKNLLAGGAVFGVVLVAPLGTVWLLVSGQLAGASWSLGNIGIYASEVIALAYLFLRGVSGREIISTLRSNRKYQLAVGAIILVLLTSFNPGRSAVAVFHLLLALMLALKLVQEKNKARIFIAWRWGLLLPLLLALGTMMSGALPALTWLGISAHDPALSGASVVIFKGERLLRAYGSFAHPNIFAGYLALSAFLLIRDRERFPRLTLVLLLAIGTALALTFSRSGILISLALVLGVLWHSKFALSVRHAIMSLGLGFLLTAIMFPTVFIDRIAEHSGIERLSVSSRLLSLEDGIRIFRRYPFFGVGPMNSVPVIAENIRPGKALWNYEPPHFTPLLILAEYGLIGTIALMIIVLAFSSRFSGAGAISVLWFGLGLFDHYLLTNVPMIMLFAIAWASSSIDRDVAEQIL